MQLRLLAALCLLAAPGARADLFVSSFSQHSVRRYDDTGAFVSTFIAAGSGGLSAPHRGMFGPDGNYYVASANNDTILRYNGQTGAFIDIFIQNGSKGLLATDTDNRLDYPVDLTIGPDGALYISSQLTSTILKFNASTGVFLGTFVSSTANGGLNGPSGIQFHGGDLFVAGRFSSRAYRYDGTTGAFELEIGAGVLSTAYGLDFGPDDSLYVASGGGNSVQKFNPTTGASLGAFVSAGSGGLSAPIGIEFGSDNQLYAASLNADSVKKYNGTTGAYVSDFVAAGSGGLDQPNFMTFSIPEPSSWSLCAGALLLLGARRRSSR